MFRNMTVSLVEHELIKTTVAKAKELRGYAEPLITLAKTTVLLTAGSLLIARVLKRLLASSSQSWVRGIRNVPEVTSAF